MSIEAPNNNLPEALLGPLMRSLFALRIGVFLVMLMWTLDKIINPAHADKVFGHFYGLEGLTSSAFIVIAILELILLLAFLAGLWRKWTYGAVLLFHGVSTLSSFNQYLDPFNNLLFFAAWPMLAACITLFWLRDWDNLFTVSISKK